MTPRSPWSLRRISTLAAAAVLVVAVGGCKKSESSGGGGGKSSNSALVGGLGDRLYEGAAEDLRVTPDGKFATFLVAGEKPRIDGIPPQMRVGELWAAGTDGGKARKLGNGVTNVPGGYLFSKDGRWALFLAGYNAANQSGALNVVDLRDESAEAVQIGRAVTYSLASPDGAHVAFVEGGVLKVGPLPKGPFREVAGEVRTASFSPDGKQLYFKRRISAAGALGVVPTVVTGKPELAKKLGDQVGDYEFSNDGKYIAFTVRSPAEQGTYDLLLASTETLAPKKIASGAGPFKFSPDSKLIARIEGQAPDELGNLFVGSVDGGAGKKVGDKVQDFDFSPDSTAIASLELYDVTARAGVMNVTELPDGTPKRVGNRVPNFVWSEDGKYVAFLSRFLKPVYSVDLMLYGRGKPSSVKANQGVFGYGFTYPGGPLIFRTNCIREGRSCDLMGGDPQKLSEQLVKAPAAEDAGTQAAAGEKGGPHDHAAAAGSAQEPLTKLLIERIFSFKTSADGSKILVTYARMDADTYDVALYDVKTQERKTLDQFAQLPAMFAAKDGSKVVYILGKQSRGPGVYVAK